MHSDLRQILALSLLILVRLVAAGLPAEKLRGISLEDLKLYQSDPIWCKDKSKSFPLSRLNDDYCDCPDGTDEPGTSACPEGKFYCKNAGHAPQFLFSSRVNDGICDCCDGSDEFSGKTSCVNTCWETGKKSREKLEKKVAVFKEGAKLRAKEIEYSKQQRKQQETELAALKKEEKSLKDLTQKLKAQLEVVEEAERQEREKKAKEEEERRKKEEALKNETIAAGSEEGLKTEEVPASTTQEPEHTEGIKTQEQEHTEEIKTLEQEHTEDIKSIPDVDEVKHPPVEAEIVQDSHEKEELEQIQSLEKPEELQEPETNEELSKEELGRLVASRWTGEKTETGSETEDQSEAGEYEKEYNDHSIPEEDDEENDDSYEYESPSSSDFREKVEEEEQTWWTRLLKATRFIYNLLGLKRMHVDTSEADRIRSDYRQSNSKLNDLHSKISELENKLKQDFGKGGEFYSLYDQCFERRQQKYVYKVCFYKDATQEEGHSSTRLGKWEGFQDEYKASQFQNGDHCWNGPERSLKLKLKCGLKSEISDVEEPSRCEYAASFWTPAVCYEEKAKELEAQLDAMRAGDAVPDHSEL